METLASIRYEKIFYDSSLLWTSLKQTVQWNFWNRSYAETINVCLKRASNMFEASLDVYFTFELISL